ncbi:NACHT domain-containing NTPase [Leptolyngbya sp. FACHB-261]|uniref:NACHT domain-containing protein n=1 Tax=Leptolyngbya sp. FACHB-261 TaxID=2692806 RepID=UPI0016863C13|nr:NACHT domain-containing protein [Leptolyngbya sp. FACHB-261]MBD2100689.1 NACHT domain-containing protein [Leptolyngbya sp. FACHB-261]
MQKNFFLLALLSAIIALLVGWLTNNLPEIPKQPQFLWFQTRSISGIEFSATQQAIVLLLLILTLASAFLVWLSNQSEADSDKPKQDEATGISSEQESRNLKILQESVKGEVEGRLSSSLHNQVRLILHMEAQPKQVERPWDVQVKIGTRPHYPLAPGTSVIEVFELPDVAGKLLLLGAPGAGKTTMLLDLAKQLIARNEEDFEQPTPVLVNLSSWQKNEQSIFDWLVAELKLKYGVRADIGQRWLRERKLLPLLDGLDELASERQAKCVEAINEWLQSDERPRHVVVCSRLEEYESHETSLNLNGAICLLPLEQFQIKEYLLRVTGPELWQSIASDPALLDLAQTPLLLSIITLAYQEISFPEWQQLASSQERQRYLFDAYIRRMLERSIKSQEYTERKEPTPEKTRHWLIWLAQRLKAEKQTEFLIEKIQPAWLQRGSQKQAYRIGVGLSGGLSVGLSGGLSGGLSVGLVSGLSVGLIFGLSVGLSDEIELVETLRWSWKNAGAGLREYFQSGRLLVGLSVGLLVGLIFGLSVGLLVGLSVGLLFGLLGGLLFGLILGLLGGLSGFEVERKAIPNQGIWRSASNAVIVGLLFGLSVGLLGGLLSGLSAGLILGMFQYGGLTCIQHFTLRLILWQSGNIPWNYARFLNYATERLFLQRVGGSYRFTHDLLREHFAQMPERS